MSNTALVIQYKTQYLKNISNLNITRTLLNCWKCKKLISDVSIKIAFRATCISCSADLHVCKNCRYYSVGKPNDCIVPGSDPISDKEQSNLCEDFKPLSSPSSNTEKDSARKIFGEDAIPPKKNFDDLFN